MNEESPGPPGFFYGWSFAPVLALQVAVKAVVKSRQFHQLVVGALLDDVAVLEHVDPVGLAHGTEAVGDDDGGAPLQEQ